jgi:hypothetical protein
MTEETTGENPEWVSAPMEKAYRFEKQSEKGTRIHIWFHLHGENHEDFQNLERKIHNFFLSL